VTTTLTLDAGAIRALETALREERYEFRPLAHAHFQARGGGVVVNAYRSGKVVVQGKGEEEFLAAHGLAGSAPVALREPVAGSDESGKGDYFGPLVVAAVVVDPAQARELARLGVRDCKRMTDGSILRAAKAIRDLLPHAVRSLSPPEYNERHAREGNVALFLSTMHAEAIAGAIRAAGGRCDHVVIDQFTFAERLESALAAEGVVASVEIRPRAEDNPAVAAASVLARAEFLIALEELGSEHGVDLPKGASIEVERTARRIFESGGMTELAQLAKTHFKTTARVTGLF